MSQDAPGAGDEHPSGSSLPVAWPVVQSRRGADHGIYRVRHDRQRSPRTGEAMERVVLEAPDWINVVALTREQEVVMVRQFRFGRRAITLEIPGGMVDPGETPEAAARRELREETGFGGGRWRLLGAVEPNPAMLDNLCFHFLAEEVRPVAEVRPDGGEDIAIHLEPLATLAGLVRQGAIRHSLVVSALSRVIDLREGGQQHASQRED